MKFLKTEARTILARTKSEAQIIAWGEEETVNRLEAATAMYELI